MNEPSQEGVTISFVDILSALRRHLKLIVGTVLLTIIATFIVTFFVVTPKYESTSQILINRDPRYARSQQTIDTYTELATSPTVLRQVKRTLNSSQSVNQLRQEVSISNSENSQIVSLKVKTTDPIQAAQIANETAKQFQKKVKQTLHTDNIVIVSKAAVSKTSVSPNVKKNMLMGVVLGLILGVVFVFIAELMDTTVRDARFLQTLNLPYLGSILEASGSQNKKSNKTDYYTAIHGSKTRRRTD